MSAAVLLALPDRGAAAAEGSFPRGPGFYFSIPKLVVLLVVYLCWVGTCYWVDRDAAVVRLSTAVWNSVLFGAGLLGFLVVWVLPWFWLALALLVVLYGTASLAYVTVRNQRVEEVDQILTGRHFQHLAARYLGLAPPEDKEEEGPAVEFLAGGEGGEERLERVARLKGHEPATLLLADAIGQRAAEVSLEPSREETAVRFAIDGLPHEAAPLSRPRGDAIIQVYKTLAGLDLAERRKPQEGAFAVRVGRRRLDCRLSTAGSILGERLVLRLFERSKQPTSLAQLGMREPLQEQIRQLLADSSGMLVVAGPAAAGKTTTVCACLGEIDRYQRNVLSLESPVKYRVSNVSQFEFTPGQGATFAGDLEDIVRQEPDVLFVGRLPDRATAEIACAAAQARCPVLTIVQADDAVAGLGRLLHLGVAVGLLAESLRAVLGQRLLRLLCSKCKVRYKPEPEVLRRANLPADRIKYFYRPPKYPGEGRVDPGQPAEPCWHCGATGYHGRTALFEILLVTDRIRDLLRQGASLQAIRQEAIRGGMRPLQEDGLRLVIEGKTAIQELLRVCK